ncbi:hypothetical protein [Pandoraea captiosa]|uniref:hypothetical protein n=1 Tax=Pandoraea captiosa TaxID=2508302 RepID=UPI001582DC5E|nr:hypothetical protein [Pandoraea captiosa]
MPQTRGSPGESSEPGPPDARRPTDLPRLQRALDGARSPGNILPDAIDGIAARQREQRTDYQKKRHETRQHIDLDTKKLNNPGFAAIVAPKA